MKLPILGLLLIGAILHQTTANGNAKNPDCTPKATNDAFDDTLIVLVFNYEDTPNLIKSRTYIFKQFACLIPITNNIKTSLLYFGKNDTKKLTDGDFMDSGELVANLTNPYTHPGKLADRCTRLKNHLHEFKNDALVKTHGNVHYIILIDWDYKCIGLDQDINMWFLIHEVKRGEEDTLSLMDDNGFLPDIDTLAPTSQPLEVFVENIVSYILMRKSSPSESVGKSNNSAWLMWIFIGLVVLGIGGLVGGWIYFGLRIRRKKKKIAVLKLKKKQLKKKMKKAKKEEEKKQKELEEKKEKERVGKVEEKKKEEKKEEDKKEAEKKTEEKKKEEEEKEEKKKAKEEEKKDGDEGECSDPDRKWDSWLERACANLPELTFDYDNAQEYVHPALADWENMTPEQRAQLTEDQMAEVYSPSLNTAAWRAERKRRREEAERLKREEEEELRRAKKNKSESRKKGKNTNEGVSRKTKSEPIKKSQF